MHSGTPRAIVMTLILIWKIHLIRMSLYFVPNGINQWFWQILECLSVECLKNIINLLPFKTGHSQEYVMNSASFTHMQLLFPGQRTIIQYSIVKLTKSLQRPYIKSIKSKFFYNIQDQGIPFDCKPTDCNFSKCPIINFTDQWS